MSYKAIIGAFLTLFCAQQAHAERREPATVAQPVKDRPAVTIDPARGYILVSSAAQMQLQLYRVADAATAAEYEQRRMAEFVEAHARWERQHNSWRGNYARWQEGTPGNRGPRPEEPIEPQAETFQITPIELENMISVGPQDRFSKDNNSVYLSAVTPGEYVLYGPVNVLPNGASLGTCMCMGSVRFEVRAGEVTNMGTARFPWSPANRRLMPDGRRMETSLDLPSRITSFSIRPPHPGSSIDPRLSGVTVRPAAYRASGFITNFYGVEIDRITAIPGVIAYDRDQVIDLSGQPANAAVGSEAADEEATEEGEP